MINVLAQIELEDWGELIIFGLVIVGSLLANVIAAIKKKKEGNDDGVPKPLRPKSEPRLPKALRTSDRSDSLDPPQPAPPIAPPAPGVELRRETQDELERLRRQARSRRQGRQFVPPPPVAKPITPPVGRAEQARRQEQEKARRAEEKRREQADNERREAARRKEAEKTPARRETFDQRAARLSRAMDLRLGHVDEGVVEDLPVEAIVPTAGHLPTLNYKTLRDAIVLSEILSPPVSLRPTDARWD